MEKVWTDEIYRRTSIGNIPSFILSFSDWSVERLEIQFRFISIHVVSHLLVSKTKSRYQHVLLVSICQMSQLSLRLARFNNETKGFNLMA